jgi:hypothetical protein
MTTPDQPTLAGLELESREELGEPGSMRVAVVATIQAMQDEGLIQPRHVALCQLALELADSVTAGRRSGRASAAAMASRELRETLLALPTPEAAEAAEAFSAWVEQTLAKEPT